MISDNGKHYLYRHVRNDKDEPFYVGIGTKRNKTFARWTAEFKRAYEKKGRGNLWDKITTKTTYSIEILMSSNDYEFIKQKEVELIKLYGRINKGTGILANLTDGGDGTVGTVHTQEMRSKITKTLLGKKGKDSRRKIAVYQYSLSGQFIKKWECMVDVITHFSDYKRQPGYPGSDAALKKAIDNKFNSSYGFQWRSNYCGENIEAVVIIPRKGLARRIQMIDKITGNAVAIFNNAYEAARSLNVAKWAFTDITRASRDNTKTAYGYKWKELDYEYR